MSELLVTEKVKQWEQIPKDLTAKYSVGRIGDVTPQLRIRKHKELYIWEWDRETIVKIDVIVRTSQDVPMPNRIMALNVCRSLINSKPTRCEEGS